MTKNTGTGAEVVRIEAEIGGVVVTGASADAANTRLCAHCSKAIAPDAETLATALSMVAGHTLVADELRRGAAAAVAVSAWLNGFCSTQCMVAAALKTMLDGRAWWSK